VLKKRQNHREPLFRKNKNIIFQPSEQATARLLRNFCKNMKKRCPIMLAALFCCAGLQAQKTWFKTPDLGFTTEVASVMVTTPEHIYALISAWNNSPPHTQNCVLKLTQQGDVVWRRAWPYPPSANADIIYHHPKMLLIAKDRSLYAVSFSADENQVLEFLLNKFNSNGDLLWSKTYGFPGTSAVPGVYSAALAADSLGVILTGRTQAPPVLQYAIAKIDSSGKEAWKRLIPAPLNWVGFNTPVVQMPDGSIKTAFDNAHDPNYRDYLMSLDSTGQVQYVRPSPLTERTVDLQRHPNGNLVYLSHEVEYSNEQRGGIRVQMLTPEFDTVWTRLFIDVEGPYYFLEQGFVHNISISPDGKILALGAGASNCSLVCYDAQGVLLWQREVALEGDFKTYGGGRFYYAAWTPDGGILLDGHIFGTDANRQYYEKVLIMKLDSVGCLHPGCQENIIVGAKEPVLSKSAFRISPNPTEGLFSIAASGQFPEGLSDYTLKVYDRIGKPVLQQTVSWPFPTLDLGGQAPGIYFLYLYGAGKAFFIDKIIKL
jgi:hypothetical protein